MEIASLRQSMTTPTANETGAGDTAMFTRLDYDHNTRELQSAVDSEQLTREAYQRVEEEMRDYLTLPSQRLAQCGRRHRERVRAEGLIRDVRREFKEKSRAAEKVVEKIASHDRERQREFEERMQGLRVRRNSLARALTARLGELGEETNTILIKPIYFTRAGPKKQPLITHLRRPVPIPKLGSKPRSQTQTRGAEGGAEFQREGGHLHSMRLVSRLVAARQGTLQGDRGTHTHSPSHSHTHTHTHTHTASLPVQSWGRLPVWLPLSLNTTWDTAEPPRSRRRGERRSGRWSSLDPEKWRDHSVHLCSVHLQIYPGSWNLMSIGKGMQEMFFFHHWDTCVYTMIVCLLCCGLYMYIVRSRHVADLLGHLLPDRELRSATPATSTLLQR